MSDVTKAEILPSGNVRTPRCRLAYANLFETKPNFNGHEKFSAVLLIDESEVDIQEWRKYAKKLFENRYGKKAAVKYDLDDLFRDGDEKDAEGFAGKTFINCSANPDHPPKVLDQKRREVSADDTPGVRSGDYVRCILRPFTWGTNKGVSFGLQAVQLIEHGTRFADNDTNPVDELDDLDIAVDDVDDDDIDL